MEAWEIFGTNYPETTYYPPVMADPAPTAGQPGFGAQAGGILGQAALGTIKMGAAAAQSAFGAALTNELSRWNEPAERARYDTAQGSAQSAPNTTAAQAPAWSAWALPLAGGAAR